MLLVRQIIVHQLSDVVPEGDDVVGVAVVE